MLGNLFMWRRKSNKVESLIITITPHILKTVAQDDQFSREALNNHKERDYFYRKYEDDTLPARRDSSPAGE